MTRGVTLAITDPITRERVEEWQEDLEEEARQHELEHQALNDAELSEDEAAAAQWWDDLGCGFIIDDLTGIPRGVSLSEHRELIESAGDKAPAHARDALRRRELDNVLIDEPLDNDPFILSEM